MADTEANGRARAGSYVRDCLVALKYAIGDIGSEPFDIRDDRICSHRVVANLIMLDQAGGAFERNQRPLYRALLADYAAEGSNLSPALRGAVTEAMSDSAASSTTLSALVGRCLSEDGSGDPNRRGLDRRAAQVQVDLLRQMEQRYRTLVAEPPPTIAGSAPVVDFDALAVLLGGGSPVALRPLHVINGGYSKVTIVCELEREGEPARRVVVRSDAGFAFAGTSVIDEYPILKAMHEAGVAVPEPIWAGRTADDALPALVVAFTDGRPFGSPATAALRSTGLCRQMGLHLARIHGVDPAVLGAIDGEGAAFNRRAVTAELDDKAAKLRATGEPMPLLDYALAWLRDRRSSVSGRIAIVHGDYAPHNLLAVGDEITGVLDWEFVKLGNPAEDLCFGRLAIEELGSFEEFLDAYAAEGGTRPSDEELHYYTVFSLYRLCVMLVQTDALFTLSEAKAIRMAAPGAERRRPSLLKLARQLGMDVDSSMNNTVSWEADDA